MKLRKPDYYDQFRCIAGNCKDNCCIGWEIDIDADKLKEYKRIKGPIGQRLKHDIDWDNGCFLLQGEEERCPFLNEENLCELILELGEGSLCEICREHPRFYDWIDDLTEAGLGLCCEAAARLILQRENADQFLLVKEYANEDKNEKKTEDGENSITEILFLIRDVLFRVAQDRNASIWNRCIRILALACLLQDTIEAGEPEKLAKVAQEASERQQEYPLEKESLPKAGPYSVILELCRTLEPIDETWTDTLERLNLFAGDRRLLETSEARLNEEYRMREYEYEHLLVYFLYRHFMKCRYDGNLIGCVRLSVFCLLLIHLMDMETLYRNGRLTEEDRVQNARICSKEIEYSEENTKQLLELLIDANVI